MSDMILRATSDLHLSKQTAPYVFAALKELYADALDHKGFTVLVGDIFNQPVSVNMPVYNRLRELLQGWPSVVYVLAGNHDQYDGWRNCLEGLAGRACRVISRPRWTMLGRMIPYTAPDAFEGVLRGLEKEIKSREERPRLIWTHHGFRGAYRNAMSIDRDGVSCRVVPPDHIVITGHYHMPQTVGRIVYCGSPYETTFAEEGQAKGWLRWDDAMADPIPVRVPFKNVGAPRHVTIYWDPRDGPPEVPDMAENDKPRIIVAGTRQDALAHGRELRAAGLEGVPLQCQPEQGSTRGIVVSGMAPRRAASRYAAAVMGLNNAMPDPDSMEEWAEEVQLWETS